MRVLVACEFSGIVRDAFAARGHDAWSCDIEPSERRGKHIKTSVLDVLDGWVPVIFSSECNEDGNCPHCEIDYTECGHPGPTQDEYEYEEINGALYARPIDCPKWHMMLAFPPCTHLCASGAKHFPAKRTDGRQKAAIDFFMALANAPIEKIAIENPVGIMSSQWRSPDQIIQPFYFGEEAQKTTCLWLKNLLPLSHNDPEKD